jgi:hypothetical protein
MGITRGGINWVSGADVDEIDVALSSVGLTATALVIVSGGSSVTVKAGASTIKLARRMNLLSSRFLSLIADAARSGDVARLSDVALDLDQLRSATSMTAALHLLPLVDDANDARRLAKVATILGPRTVAVAEVLGKARLMRLTLRISETAWRLIAGLAGLAVGLASLIGSLLQTLLFRAVRRMAKT